MAKGELKGVWFNCRVEIDMKGVAKVYTSDGEYQGILVLKKSKIATKKISTTKK